MTDVGTSEEISPHVRTDTVHDGVLEGIINVIAGRDDASETALGITLLVQGAVVSGLLCSSSEWVNAHRGLGASPDAEAFVEGFVEALGGAPRPELRADQNREFIHMKTVNIQAGGASFVCPAWRGRLSDVSGWSLGS